MSWIKIVPPEEAEGDLRRAYATAGASRGRVANILAVHGVRPKVLEAHLDLYREVMFGESELSRAERETVAVAVSSANECFY